MRATLLSVFLIAFAACALPQTKLTFQLDLDPLVKEELFSPQEGHRVFLRGSFNGWQGSTHEIKKLDGSNLYAGSFEMEGNPGDTLSYKYVIEKEPGHFFWEDEPEPENPDHGNRRIVLREKEQVLPPAIFHQDEYFSFPVVFPREKLQADYRQFRSILEEVHPALYDYTSKTVLDSLFDHNYSAIQSDMDFRSFLILMTEVISRVGCGHSSLWIPGAYWSVTPSGLFPLRIASSGDKFFITGSFDSTMTVPAGSEMLSINGLQMNELVSCLESLSSSDGLIHAYRRAKVTRHFAVKYAMAYGLSKGFNISYLPPHEEHAVDAVLQPVSKAQVDRGMEVHNELSLKEMEQGEVALLTINSFAYYGEVPMFRAFIDSVFQVVEQKGIDRLILDLRGNGGGDPFCSSYLWGYLQPESLPYFEDHYGRYDTLANEIPQPPKHYGGQLYTLINGHCFSTTGHFCGLLKYHHVGKFVGSETGATFTCTGNATYPALDETGIMVGTARVGRYTAAVKGMDPRQGIKADYPVESTQEDIICGRDAVLEYALSLATKDLVKAPVSSF